MRISIVRLCVRVAALGCVSVAPFAAQGRNAARTADADEAGTFRLHKFEQAIGEEKYTITRAANEVTLDSAFEFTDRGTRVPLTAKLRTLRARSDLLLRKATSLGEPRSTPPRKHPDKIHIRLKKTQRRCPSRQILFHLRLRTRRHADVLMRYWESAGRPATLQTFPAGEIAIEDRGADTVSANGQQVKLERFGISGLIWGRETLWMRESHLVALVTVDAEFDHFEAVAPGFESSLPDFVRIAGADGMASLADISRGFRSSPGEGITALAGATLIDGTGASAVPDSLILVRGGKIEAAGQRDKVAIPKNAKIIDLKGKTIAPGLWDMHAHFEQVEWGPVYLAAGVTTVRDVGNEFEFVTAIRDAIASGRGVGPRLLLAESSTAAGSFRWASTRSIRPPKPANGSTSITTPDFPRSKSTAR
jgi:hypothetical protein